MIKVQKEGVVIGPQNKGFESDGVINPAVIVEGAFVHLFYRAVTEGNHSSIGYCKLEIPIKVIERKETPVIASEYSYESYGIEDPRIVKIDDLYYLSYTAYDGVNALGALATSTDLKNFKKLGLIVPSMSFSKFKQLAEKGAPLNKRYSRYNKRGGMMKHHKKVVIWIKNVVFFPRRINGMLCLMIRIKPDIQLVMVASTDGLTQAFWNDYFLHLHEHVIMEPKYPHEISYIGSGCPPLETEQGWLMIYHGVYDSPTGYVYTTCVALLSLHAPLREISRLPYPLFTPEHDYELWGRVNNVCFATGAFLKGDTLYIYYGAADTRIACASVGLTSLLDELLLNMPNNEKN